MVRIYIPEIICHEKLGLFRLPPLRATLCSCTTVVGRTCSAFHRIYSYFINCTVIRYRSVVILHVLALFGHPQGGTTQKYSNGSLKYLLILRV